MFAFADRSLSRQTRGSSCAGVQARIPMLHSAHDKHEERAEASGGRPLEGGIRSILEQRFQAGFRTVRVHDDAAAARAADAQGARAFALGEHIFMARAVSPSGRPDLVAHELTHVLQQRRGARGQSIARAGDASAELEARRAGASFRWGSHAPGYRQIAGAIEQRGHDAGAVGRVTVAQSAPRAVQRVELSYDDGPDAAGNTRKVLDALKAAGARATFYLVGKRVAQGDNWKVVFDMAASGQWLGNHAFDWNDAKDEHIFLHGTVEDRAQKILLTEWAIRDALTRGKDEAKKTKSWDSIPTANRQYIDDVIARGTGRFRTPGFRSKTFHRGGTITTEDATTGAAIASTSHVLAAIGMRPLTTTTAGALGEEGVDVDPKDYASGRTKDQIESSVKSGLDKNTKSVLLHSRVAATAEATPGILADIQSRKFTFDPTAQGQMNSVGPSSGFAKLNLSNPVTSSDVAKAREFFRKNIPSVGPMISGATALGIFQLAQRVGPTEVAAFAAEIKSIKVDTDAGPTPLANWMNANEEWRLFASFFENLSTNKPLPHVPGVTQ